MMLNKDITQGEVPPLTDKINILYAHTHIRTYTRMYILQKLLSTYLCECEMTLPTGHTHFILKYSQIHMFQLFSQRTATNTDNSLLLVCLSVCMSLHLYLVLEIEVAPSSIQGLDQGKTTIPASIVEGSFLQFICDV